MIQCTNPQISVFGGFMWNEVFQHPENWDVVGLPIYRTFSGDVLHAQIDFAFGVVVPDQLYQHHATQTALWYNLVSEEKVFTDVYVVYEKKEPSCAYYPARQSLEFYDIGIRWDDGSTVPQWTTNYSVDACDNRATVQSLDCVLLTWNTTL